MTLLLDVYNSVKTEAGYYCNTLRLAECSLVPFKPDVQLHWARPVTITLTTLSPLPCGERIPFVIVDNETDHVVTEEKYDNKL